MDGIFGVGPLEILLVLVLALILLGPQDMVKTAQQLGRTFYRLYHSPVWRQIISTQQELRDLPNKFVREAGLEDTIADLKKTSSQVQAEIKNVTSAAKAELNAASHEIKSEIDAAAQQAVGEVKGAADEVKAPPSVPFQPTPAPAAPAPPTPDKPDEFSI